MIRKIRGFGVALVLAGGLGACADEQSDSVEPTLASSLSAELVECPSSTTYETTGLVLPLGGSVSLRGHSVVLPLDAVTGATTITLTEPASKYIQINLGANGQDHWQFNAPLLVTISYARCNRADINKGALSVWLVDEQTGELLANMGGVDNKLTRTITFVTDHFSGYAIAN